MRFEKTKLSLAVCSIFLGLNAHATVVFDKEVANYDDVITPTTKVEWVDGENSKQFAVLFEPGETYNYVFNKGGVLNNLAIFGGGEEYPTDVVITTAKNASLTIGSTYGRAIYLETGGKLDFIGGDLTFGTPITEYVTATVSAGSELTINAQSVTFDTNINAIDVRWHPDLRDEHGTAVFRATTENDFIINSNATTMTIHTWCGINGGALVDISSGNDIHLNSLDGKGDGIYTAADGTIKDYDIYTGRNNVKLTAKNKIVLDGYEKGIVTLGASTVQLKANQIDINTSYVGIHRYSASDWVPSDGEVSLNAAQINILSPNRAIFTDSPGSTILNATERISLNDAQNSLATTLEAKDPGTKLLINRHQTHIGQLLLTGGISAYNKALIDVSGGRESIFTGWTSESKPLIRNDFNYHDYDKIPKIDGTINLQLGENSKWILTDDSSLSSLTLNKSIIDFSSYQPVGRSTSSSANAAHKYRSLTTKKLLGTGNIFDMHVDLVNESADQKLVDQLIVTESVEGKHIGRIFFENGGSTDKNHTVNWLVSQTNGTMTITAPNGGNQFAAPGALSYWALKFVDNKTSIDNLTPEELNALPNVGTGEGNWYLVRVDKPIEPEKPVEPEIPVDPEKPIDPIPPSSGTNPAPVPEVLDNLSIGTSTGQALAYFADLEDLHKRIGEVRYGAQDGAWVKAFTKKEKIGDGSALEQDVNGINVGLDTLVAAQEGSAWLVGGAFRYSNADQEGVALKHVSGELDEYSLKAYATWMHEQGSYADFVLQAGRYKQSLNGLDNTATGSSNAKYRTWGYGGSVEVGHMFSFANDADDSQWTDHWFVEPQLQLAYFHAKGADYHTSTGLKVDQGDADFLMGRAGVAIGKKFNFGDANSLDRRYFQVSAIGGVKHDFIGGDQTIRYTGVDKKTVSVKADELDDTRFYYGVNFDWQLANNWRVYGQVSREEGDQYTKDYDFSLGLKYAF